MADTRFAQSGLGEARSRERAFGGPPDVDTTTKLPSRRLIDARMVVVAIASNGSYPSCAAYEDRLKRGGFEASRHRPGSGGLKHVVYLAHRPA